MSSFEEIGGKIIETTIEIFTSMVMMEVNSGGEAMTELGSLNNSITGMVGLAGSHKGVLAIHIPNEVAMAITGNFLGMEVDSINEDVQDAVGELANMLGGNLKTILSDKGKDIQLSLPSTISGEQYTFTSQVEVDQIILPFTTAVGKFFVEVELAR